MPPGETRVNPNKIFQAQIGQTVMNPVPLPHVGIGKEWKTILFDAITVVFAGLFGYAFSRYLYGGLSFWWVVSALLIWCAVSVIEGLLQKDLKRRFIFAALEAMALLIFFFTLPRQALVLSGVITILVLVWGYVAMRHELENSVEVQFFTVSGKMVGKVVTAAVAFMIIMYASFTTVNGSFFVSENGFNVFYNWAAQFANNFYPTIQFNGSVENFAKGVAREQWQNNPAFAKLSPSEQSTALSQAEKQILGALTIASGSSSTPEIAPTSTEPTSHVFYNYLAAQANTLQNRFNDFFIGAWGIMAFLIARGIGIIVVWVGQFVALILYELLLAADFMKVIEETATRETIAY
jgi:hypothetical protein